MLPPTPYSVHHFSAPTCLRSPTQMALKILSPSLQSFKDGKSYSGTKCQFLDSKILSESPCQKTCRIISCAINMTAGQSDGSGRLSMDHAMGEMRKVWKILPQPIKTFPWIRALENLQQLILGLVFAVAKYLSVPLVAVSSLSEMSYSAHERKMVPIPILLFAGIALAGVLRETALELYPHIKEGEFPWHLVAIAFFFALLKLPGPYYPYWGRLLIPHFANGGLLRTLWFAFRWYREPQVASETTLQQSSVDLQQSSVDDQQFVQQP